jgi:ATP-dependent DNA helicase RecG
MKQSLNKLVKIFKLEADNGFDNRAVIGGLERMLESWEAEARLEAVPEDLIQVVALRLHDYARLSPASRAETLEGLWHRLERESDAPLPPFPRPQKRPGSSPRPPQPRRAEQPQDGGQVKKPQPQTDERPAAAGEPEVGAFPAAAPPAAVQPTAVAEPPRPAPAFTGPPAALNAPTHVLAGIGPKLSQTLSRLGMENLGDMLYNFPRRYDDYSKLKPINRLRFGEEVTVIGTVQSVVNRPVRGGALHITEAIIHDGTGALRLNWFNQPWVGKRLQPNEQISVSGKVEQYLGRLVMKSPECEPLDQTLLSTNRIVPVYPLTAHITQRWLRQRMNQVVTYWAPRVQDPLPERVRRAAGVIDLPTALLQIHFPDSHELLKAARQRLAFDEILLLQLGVLGQKRAWQERTARPFATPDDWLAAQVQRLPFPLTGAQQRALQEVRNDLSRPRPMNRLLQGDVGSGKTVIAALAVAMVARHGAQSAVMAPTSILAEQHYKNLRRLLAEDPPPQPAPRPADAPPFEEADLPADEEMLPERAPLAPPVLRPEEIRLMIGATPEAEKAEIRKGLADGSIKLVIGTHALIEDPVTFADLELTVVDEQHRFGVEQRASLRSKGTNPHLLVMTATPIPRSLALTVYGDLDLSVMDEMPPGRQPVGTYVLAPRERERAYSLIRSQVEQGRQAFIIYPLVEEGENGSGGAKAAVEEHARLQKEIFPKFTLGLLHGRMRPEEKDEVMGRFRAGEIQVLVSTSVVEVGVDVPNATVMLIEGANRFGLAQLHQFRGRVGRGAEKAYCLLIPDTPDQVENERLQVMSETNDGFVLAEKDLEQRGPGEFLGTRQSGFSGLRLANLTDVRLIEAARRQAQAIFELDPNLSHPEHQLLAASMRRFWGTGQGDIS